MSGDKDNKVISSGQVLSAVRSPTKSPSAIYQRGIKFCDRRRHRGRKGAPRLPETCSDEADEYTLEFVARIFEFVIAIVVGDRYVIVGYRPQRRISMTTAPFQL